MDALGTEKVHVLFVLISLYFSIMKLSTSITFRTRKLSYLLRLMAFFQFNLLLDIVLYLRYITRYLASQYCTPVLHCAL